MKRLILTVVCLAAISAVLAQSDTLPKPIYSTELSDNRTLQIDRRSEGGEAVLSLLGYEITLSGQNCKKPKRVQLSIGITHGELGFATLSEPDYSQYDPEMEGFLRLNGWKSYHVSFRLLNVRVALNRSRSLFFNAGLGMSIDRYLFSDNLILDNIEGRIVPVTLEKGSYNGQLGMIALNIPLQLDVALGRKFTLSGYASVDFNDSAISRFRNRSTSILLPGVRTVTVSVGASVTWDGLGVYVRYGTMPIFRSSTGLVTRPLSLGLAIAF